MTLHLHLWKDFFNDAVRVDDKSSSFHAHVFAPIHAFLFPNAIEFSSFMIRIGQKRKREIEFAFERCLRFGLIGRYTNDYGVIGRELRRSITEPASFRRAARSIGLRIKVQNNILAL